MIDSDQINKLNYIFSKNRSLTSSSYNLMLRLYRYFCDQVQEATIEFPVYRYGFTSSSNRFHNSVFKFNESSGKSEWRDPSIDELKGKDDFDNYWCTFADYTRSTLKNNNGNLEVEIIIFEDRWHGSDKLERIKRMVVTFPFTVYMAIEPTFFGNFIDNEIHDIVEEEYEEYLEMKKNNWMNNRKNKIQNNEKEN